MAGRYFLNCNDLLQSLALHDKITYRERLLIFNVFYRIWELLLKEKEMRIRYETDISCDFFDIVFNIHNSDGVCIVAYWKV